MKVSPSLIRTIYERVNEQRPTVTEKDIRNASIEPVDRNDELRLQGIEKHINKKLDRTHTYKMTITRNALVYLYVTSGSSDPELIFTVMITKEKKKK